MYRQILSHGLCLGPVLLLYSNINWVKHGMQIPGYMYAPHELRKQKKTLIMCKSEWPCMMLNQISFVDQNTLFLSILSKEISAYGPNEFHPRLLYNSRSPLRPPPSTFISYLLLSMVLKASNPRRRRARWFRPSCFFEIEITNSWEWTDRSYSRQTRVSVPLLHVGR